METIVYAIGVFVVAVILYAIPILTACSFIYKWDAFFQLMLIVASVIELCGLYTLIADNKSDKGR